MRTEIRKSASKDAPNPWVWRAWEHGQLVAQGQSPSEEEAKRIVHELVGEGKKAVWTRAKAIR